MRIEDLKPGDILQGIEPGELVEIESIKQMGSRILVAGFICSTKRKIQRPLLGTDFERITKVRSSGFSYDGDAEKFLIGTEAERISIAYQFDPMFAVNSSVVDELPHQVEAVYKYLLPLPRIRFLLADDTGAGKTIMAGLLLKELFFRGTIQRALIITPGGLTKQWQEDELQEKFGLQFKLIDRAIFRSNPNEFATSDRCVTSLDFIRQPDVLAAVETLPWDIIIVDEAHKLSAYEYGTKIDKRERYKALEKLSKRTDHLLFLTATPHRGRKDTFRRLMLLLDEDLFTKDEHVQERIKQGNEAFEFEGKITNANNKFFLRRLKEDMLDWDSKQLFVQRRTKTVGYDLTPEEFRLYSAVTRYVQRLRKEAKAKRNKNVELMLMVMQRRLASSLFAITQTLVNRAARLQEVLHMINEARRNQKKLSVDSPDDTVPDSYDEYEEMSEEQRDRVDQRINRFVLSLDPADIQKELSEVNDLVTLAKSLKGHEEQKFAELRTVLDDTDILRSDEGKLVIFTEHRDTLENLRERLVHKGIPVSIIHGAMNVDERKRAQREFRLKSKIMIATDAAGEGINLQFCSYLINWDIPWNPNRLEQRMGRIHRYGQKNVVRVYNLVAQNTREGMVLKRLLDKLDIMREQLGTDRVYDVIDELLEDVPLSELITHTAHQQGDSEIDRQLGNVNEERAKEIIALQKKQSLVSKLDLSFSQTLRSRSDERRLQPLYIERFFVKAFSVASGSVNKDEQYPVVYLSKVPKVLLDLARERRSSVPEYYEKPFVFDKNLVSIASPVKLPEGTKLMGPGHPLFEVLIEYAKRQARESFARGSTILDPSITSPHRLWLVRSTVKDNRAEERNRTAHQKLVVAISDNLGLRSTTASYLIDCCSPAGTATIPVVDVAPANEEISVWAYENITEAQLSKVKKAREQECAIREQYLRTAFTDLIMDRQSEVNDLDAAALLGENVEKEREQLQLHIMRLKERREQRLAEIGQMLSLNAELPEVLTSAMVLPLSLFPEVAIVENDAREAMRRDDEVERIAMDRARQFEEANAGRVFDESSENVGYDIRSERADGDTRYIEVKGRAQSGPIIVTENELNRLRQLGERAWLYIVTHCKTESPLLRCIQNPVATLQAKEVLKQIQYLVAENDWKSVGEEFSTD